MTQRIALSALAFAIALGSSFLAAQQPVAPAAGKAALIERGKYLVEFGSCHDCHTPWQMGPKGPEPDMTRALTGHPQEMAMPPAPSLPPGPWMTIAAGSMTAWAGPFGVSFTRNLTPDKETGLGDWTVEEFIATMKTGRERGKGRPVMPPMPIQNLAALSDSDIRALFAYLQSLPPIKNRTPQPIEPPDQQ
jgi:mono/diheme cytochrome c family protein